MAPIVTTVHPFPPASIRSSAISSLVSSNAAIGPSLVLRPSTAPLHLARVRPASQAVDVPTDAKADLHRYLQTARDALVWKLDGLSDYDVRRPLVPTGTNLLGLVKHVASVESGYLGETF